MAVLEHEVHERTREATDTKWGCYNRPEYSQGYFAPDREYSRDGYFEVVATYIPHAMSTTCRNDVSLTDRKCVGCIHAGQGEKYSEMVRSNGN